MQQKSTNCCKLALTICPSLFTFSSRFRGALPNLYDTRQKLSVLGCRNWDQLVSEAGGFPLELLHLQLPVLKFLEGGSFVHVFHPVAQHAVNQAGQLGRHGLNGHRSP